MRKSTSVPIEVSRRLVAVFAAIWHSITDRDRIQPLAGKRPIRPISTSPSQPRRRHNQSGEPLINSLQTVQGNRATSNNPSEIKKALNQIKSFDYRRVSYELNMMGSDDVVRAMNSLMQHIYSLEREGTSGKPEDMLVYWGGVLLAIRRDLGNNKTGLTEVDMLRGQIKDIDQLIKS